jgi:DNA-binding NtrC family response regulator
MIEAIVYVVDDDPSMREMLASLLRSVGLRVELFGSAPELLQSKLRDVPSCLVLDVRLPGLGGLDLQAELAKANIRTPIIFMSGYGDIPMTVRNGDILPANNRLKHASPTDFILASARLYASGGGLSEAAPRFSLCTNLTAPLPAFRRG